MKNNLACAVCSGIMALQGAAGADWYVSPNGWHANTGQSLEQAWQTIPYAMTRASDGDTIWVDAGTYEIGSDVGYPAGSQLPARWAIYKAVTVRSLHGAGQTFVVGQRHSEGTPLGEYAMRGVYLGENATLIGVTIQNGHTRTQSSNITDLYGGGVLAASASAAVYDCVIRDCSANSMAGGAYRGTYTRTRIERNSVPFGVLDGGGGVAQAALYDCTVASNEFYGNLLFFAGHGGGAYQSTLYNCWIDGNRVVSGCGGGLYGSVAYNCILRGNQATQWNEQDSNRDRGAGGGARETELYNCTLAGNYAQKYAGGADRCTTVVNSILVDNQSGIAHPNHLDCFMAYSCSQPAPTGGVGNVDADPKFAGADNFRLTASSPCRDAGIWTAWMDSWPWDYERNYREPGTVPDMGAYEYSGGAGWDSGYTDIGGGWRRLSWFGDYVPMGGEGWIWHNKHGFWFATASSMPTDIWFYSADMGWLWTGNATYPFLYRSSDGAWLWYNGATGPRWFRNMTTGQWESRP